MKLSSVCVALRIGLLAITLLSALGSEYKAFGSPSRKPPVHRGNRTPAPANRRITANSAGPLRLKMTVTQARQAMPGWTFERTSDGEGVALIAVRRGTQVDTVLYAGEENAQKPVNPQAKIELIEVLSPNYVTAAGVHPGMSLRQVAQKYGPLKSIQLSEIEAREFATFTRQPAGLEFRVEGKEHGQAGLYPPGKETPPSQTRRYSSRAYVHSILVQGVRKP